MSKLVKVNKTGFTGISYPFRISNRGGVVMSTTSSSDVQHIEESIKQILITDFLERPMETDVYSNVSDFLFEINDEITQDMLKTQIAEDIEECDDRVEVDPSDIEIEVVNEDGVENIYVTITYTVLKYESTYTSTIKVGEANV